MFWTVGEARKGGVTVDCPAPSGLRKLLIEHPETMNTPAATTSTPNIKASFDEVEEGLRPLGLEKWDFRI